MSSKEPNTITAVTRKGIFRALRENRYRWWGDSTEDEVLARVFDLEFMESTDTRYDNAADDIRVHRVAYQDWDDDWLFTDDRFNLMDCPDETLLSVFETFAHPLVQPDSGLTKWFVDIVNAHLALDGWSLGKDSTISGRPVYKARRVSTAALQDPSRYIVPAWLEFDIESALYTLSRLFAHQGNTTEVALLADAFVELVQTGQDSWDGGILIYALCLRVPAALYAQVAANRSDFEQSILSEMAPLFPHRSELHEVRIQPFQRAVEGWQDKAKVWLSGQGVTNQGRVRSTAIAHREHDGLLFRSEPEILLYRALKQRSVAFAPLPVFLRGGDSYQRLEPDFIILKDGVFAVVEVDGDTFHRESPSAARVRLKLLEDAGAYIIRVNASSCSTEEFAEACADDILRDIATHKNNRR